MHPDSDRANRARPSRSDPPTARGLRRYAGIALLALGLLIAPLGAAAARLEAGGDHADQDHSFEDHSKGLIDGIVLTRAELTGTNLSKSEMRDADLHEAILVDADLSKIYAERSDFSGADLTGVMAEKAHLQSASFVLADLSGASLEKAHAEQALFQAAVLSGANLVLVLATGTDFSHADLSDVTGTGMNLVDAVLVGTILDGADLSASVVGNADFSGASLLGADLSVLVDAASARFDGARYDDDTLLDPAIDTSLMIHVGDAEPVVDPGCETGVCDPPVGAVEDTDGDGWMDDEDNCLAVPNAAQFDGDADGYGNSCDADLNNDGIVGGPDFGLFGSLFGTTNAAADFNGDGFVGGPDFSIIGGAFGSTPGPSGLACAGTVPCN